MSEKKFTLADLRAAVDKLQEQLVYGCSNHGCIIRSPAGMATNAGCRCQPYRIARDLRKLAEAVELVGTSWERRT